MHKGKAYRRVLPPALYVNLNLAGPLPVRMEVGIGLRHLGIQVRNAPADQITLPAFVLLAQNIATWRLEWNDASFDFHTTFSFQQIGHGPEYSWDVFTSDDFGGFNLTRYRLPAGQSFLFGLIYFDLLFVSEQNTGLFNGMTGWSINPLRYPLEP